MGRKVKFSAEEKLKYVLRCIEGMDSINHTADVIRQSWVVIQLLTKRNPLTNIVLMILAGGFNVAGKLSKTH